MIPCRGCGAPIYFVTTAAGKSMPLDVTLLVTDDPRVVLYSREGARIEPTTAFPTRRGYGPHWATCPAAARFKRGGVYS